MTDQTAESPFSWLRTMRAPLDVMMSPASGTAFDERMLRTDREAAGDDMRAKLSSALGSFFDRVYSANPGNGIDLVRTGTGTGKTSLTQSYIAEDPRTYEWDGREDEDGYPGPIVVLMPTYQNIAELRGKAEVLGLDGKKPARILAMQARARGIIHERDVDAYVEAMADKRLKTITYKGKIAAGCKRAAEVTALMAAGLPSSRLCQTGGLRCPFFSSCKAISQREDLHGAHVVYLPRSFLDLQIPDELKKVRAVIADESVWPLLVHSETMPLHTITMRRDPPARLPEGITQSADELLAHRDLVSPVVRAALKAGQDSAQALLEHVVDVPGFGDVPGFYATGIDGIAAVCGAAVLDRAKVHPLMTAATIAAMAGKARGRDIGAEARFWQIVAEGVRKPGHPDPRIQLLGRDTESPMIRISWLSEANWQDVPLLLLDASGDAEITRRVFPGREITVHEVPVDLNLRVLACVDRRFSIREIVPGSDATPKQLFAAATLLHQIRCVISAICGVHAYGRVLIGMPKRIRKAVQRGWEKPGNADFLHSGAEAGLDFARQHVAVVSFGRLELPVAQIDAQVGALTAADSIPELPIDINGTGVDDEGRGIYPHEVTRTIRMRDGSDIYFHAHEHAGAMAARVQRQHREERIRQLIGRLRAFYRPETTAAYLIGQAVPEDIIVDELCTWDDLVNSGAAMWDVVRQAGGLLSAKAMAKASPEQASVQRYQSWIDRLPDSVVDGYHGATVNGVDIGIPGHLDTIPTMRGMDPESVVLTYKHTPAAPEGRADDEIELFLGDRRARRKAERAGIKSVRQFVRRRGEWRPAGQSYRAGTGDLERVRAPLGVWAAMQTLRDPWVLGDEVEAADMGREAVA